MKIVVTGGAGFIGSHLTERLLKEGHHVTVLDNLANGTLENLSFAKDLSNFCFVKGDITIPDTCNTVLKGADIVYHLACLGVRHSIHSPVENHLVNAHGSINVLEAARKNMVKRFFYISTSEVYGSTTMFPITEDAPVKPNTVYGASKLAGENYASAYHKCYGMDVTILRIFNNYGPRAHYEGDAGELIPRSIINLLYGKQPVIFGDGLVTRDFFYVKDTAEVLASLISHDNLAGSIINIGTGKEYTIRSVIEIILELMDKKDVGIIYEGNRPADVPRLWVNADKFHNITKFESEYSFVKGLSETISYYTEMAKNKNLLSVITTKNWEK